MKAAHQREVAGGKVLHMEVGQPSVGAPSAVLDAAKASLDACGRGETTLGYTVADGTDGLVREECRGADPSCIVDTAEALLSATATIFSLFLLFDFKAPYPFVHLCFRQYNPPTHLPHPYAMRARIVKHYKDRYGVDVDEDGVMVTTGSSAAFVLGFIAAFGPGDRVAIATPVGLIASFVPPFILPI